MKTTMSAESIKKTIAYFHLLSFCPPDKLADFKRNTAPMLKNLAGKAGMKEKAYLAQTLPEVCQRIVAFHQATREPDPKLVEPLVEAARTADKNAKSLAAFKEQMSRVASLPGRAKPENRLHRNKGCRLCTAPCLYGYFTLVSDPQTSQLQVLFAAESGKPVSEQTPLRPVYGFAIAHLRKLIGSQQGFYEISHLANLSYCLLLLGMAKSRLALPEKQLLIFQAANQEFIRRQGS
jgi:hypothetical protein